MIRLMEKAQNIVVTKRKEGESKGRWNLGVWVMLIG